MDTNANQAVTPLSAPAIDPEQLKVTAININRLENGWTINVNKGNNDPFGSGYGPCAYRTYVARTDEELQAIVLPLLTDK